MDFSWIQPAIDVFTSVYPLEVVSLALQRGFSIGVCLYLLATLYRFTMRPPGSIWYYEELRRNALVKNIETAPIVGALAAQAQALTHNIKELRSMIAEVMATKTEVSSDVSFHVENGAFDGEVVSRSTTERYPEPVDEANLPEVPALDIPPPH